MNDRPIGVLFVTHSGRQEGPPRHLHSLLTVLDRKRFEPTVVVSVEGEFTAGLRRIGIEPVVRPLPAWVGPRQCAAACAAEFATGFDRRIESLQAVIRSRDVRLVVSDTALIADGAIAAARAALPHVWRVHELLERDPTVAPPIALRSLYGLMTSLSDRIVVASHAVRDEIASFAPADDVIVIPAGWPQADGAGQAATGADIERREFTGKRITFLGDVSARNGVLTLVAAAAEVLQRHADATFWLVGPDDGGADDVVEALRQGGIERKVFVLGERGDRDEILRQSRAVVLPAVADPCPLSVLEAMRCGLPVVATRSGGCEDMIVDGETGYLVPIGDAPLIADRICRLLDDPVGARGLGDRARRRFLEQFAGSGRVRDLEEVLTELAARGRRPASSLDGTAVGLLEDAYAAIGRWHASRRQLEQATRELKATQRRLFDIEQSLVWRSTTPVRTMVDRIRAWLAGCSRRP